MAKCYLDFEFRHANERHPHLVCAATLSEAGEAKDWWLETQEDQAGLVAYLKTFDTLVGYAITAEARCLLALGQDPAQWKWTDLHAEFVQLCNWANRWRYGVQWVNSGGNWVKKNCRFDPAGDEVLDEEGMVIGSNGPVCTLVNARLKFLRRDDSPQEKDMLRDLILCDRAYTEHERFRIQAYCRSDVQGLPELDQALRQAYLYLLRDAPHHHAWAEGHRRLRGRYTADLAKVEQAGIPVRVDAIHNLSKNHARLARFAIARCNAVYPFYVREKCKWVQKQEEFERFLAKRQLAEAWPKTDAGQCSMDDKVLKDNEQIPEISALRECRKFLQQIKWYRPEALPNLLDNIGSDGRLRPYLKPFGTLSGRNAPPAKVFIPAQSRWLRSLIQAPPGKCLVAADFAQQEFFLAAELSRDANMIASYASGDVYMDFARQSKLVPAEATAQSHPVERKLCKGLVLGLQYGMGVAKLARNMSFYAGQEVSQEKATHYLDLHHQIYSTYWLWLRELVKTYRTQGCLTLPGWTLFGDHPKALSVRNFPIQGMGAAILREALHRALGCGLDVAFTLHDAMYVVADADQAEACQETLLRVMREAVAALVKPKGQIRIDASIHTDQELWVEAGTEDVVQQVEQILQQTEPLMEEPEDDNYQHRHHHHRRQRGPKPATTAPAECDGTIFPAT